MKKLKFRSVGEVWKAIDAGLSVYWVHDGYQVLVITADLNQYTAYSYRRSTGQCLRVTFIENYFGSVLCKSELKSLFAYVPVQRNRKVKV